MDYTLIIKKLINIVLILDFCKGDFVRSQRWFYSLLRTSTCCLETYSSSADSGEDAVAKMGTGWTKLNVVFTNCNSVLFLFICEFVWNKLRADIFFFFRNFCEVSDKYSPSQCTVDPKSILIFVMGSQVSFRVSWRSLANNSRIFATVSGFRTVDGHPKLVLLLRFSLPSLNL
jgi:hypothetical protein